VEIGRVEPPKHGLSGLQGKPAIPTSNSLYQNNIQNTTDQTFSPAETGHKPVPAWNKDTRIQDTITKKDTITNNQIPCCLIIDV